MTTLRTNTDVPSPFLRLIAGMVFSVFVFVLCSATMHTHDAPVGADSHNDCQLCHVVQQKMVVASTPHVLVVHAQIVPPATPLLHCPVVLSAPERTQSPPRAPPIETA